MKDEKSSLITKKLSGQVVKTSVNNTNEIIHPIATDSSSKTKTVHSNKLSAPTNKLDEKAVSKSIIMNNNVAKQRRQDISKKFNNRKHSTNKIDKDNEKFEKTCHFTFIFDPNGRFSYWIGIYIFFIYIL